jgi:hypothetical protein
MREIPTAQLEPRTARVHAERAVAQARHGLHRTTTNAITRSGWFVAAMGALIFCLAFAMLRVPIPDDFGVPYHDGPCAGKVSCPELNK